MINIELSFINKNLLKKRARFQKYDSKEPGGVKSTTVEIKVIIWQMKKKTAGFLYFFVFCIDTIQKRVYIIIIRQEREP